MSDGDYFSHWFHYSRRSSSYPRRFPRGKTPEKEIILRTLAEVKHENPPERWDRRGIPQAVRFDRTMDWALKKNSSELRQVCAGRGMSSMGDKAALIKRVYLSIRAHELKLGNPSGWAEGCKLVVDPDQEFTFYYRAKLFKRFPRIVRRFSRMVFPRVGRYPREIGVLRWCLGCGNMCGLTLGELRKSKKGNQTWAIGTCNISKRSQWVHLTSQELRNKR